MAPKSLKSLFKSLKKKFGKETATPPIKPASEMFRAKMLSPVYLEEVNIMTMEWAFTLGRLDVSATKVVSNDKVRSPTLLL